MGVRRNIYVQNSYVISVRCFVPKTHYKGVITFPYTTFIGISGKIIKKLLKVETDLFKHQFYCMRKYHYSFKQSPWTRVSIKIWLYPYHTIVDLLEEDRVVYSSNLDLHGQIDIHPVPHDVYVYIGFINFYNVHHMLLSEQRRHAFFASGSAQSKRTPSTLRIR